jgi:hypothetical protein
MGRMQLQKRVDLTRAPLAHSRADLLEHGDDSRAGMQTVSPERLLADRARSVPVRAAHSTFGDEAFELPQDV